MNYVHTFESAKRFNIEFKGILPEALYFSRNIEYMTMFEQVSYTF